MTTRGINIPLDIGASIIPWTGKTGNNTAEEDSPSSPSPARISKMRNVLPTQLGYKSAFSPAFPLGRYQVGDPASPKFIFSDPPHWDSTSDPAFLNRNSIKSLFIQEVVAYETGSLTLLYFILAESGVWVNWPGYQDGWFEAESSGREVFLEFESIFSIDPVQGEFRLWTHCILDNRLFLYRQGMEELIIVGDLTLSSTLSNWGVDFDIIARKEGMFIEVAKLTPKFLNMEGQVGVFKAGNRLGFWDSDNAIAWSSAFNAIDFTPDVVSLAGITKFSDVQGIIVKILPTTEGFIVYSTGSIVRVDPLSGSEERWGATTLLKGHGIAYYTHASSGPDPEYHVAWTSTGLFEIRGRQLNPMHVEEFRWLSAPSLESGMVPAIQVRVIGKEFITISKATFWDLYPANTFLRQGSLEGEDGNYNFFLPNIPDTPEWSPGIFNIIQGQFPEWDHGHLRGEEWELVDDLPNPADQEPLVPCFSGYRYSTPTNFHLLSVSKSGEIPMPTWQHPGYPDVLTSRASTVDIKVSISPVVCQTVPNAVSETIWVPDFEPSYEWRSSDIRNEGRRFIDSAGDDFIEEITTSVEQFLIDAGKYKEMMDASAMAVMQDLRSPCGTSIYDWLSPNAWEDHSSVEMPEVSIFPEMAFPIGLLSEEVFAEYSWALSSVIAPEFLESLGATKILRVTGKYPMPFTYTPRHVVDSCGYRIMAFVDYPVIIAGYLAEPSLFEEGVVGWDVSGEPIYAPWTTYSRLNNRPDGQYIQIRRTRGYMIIPASFMDKSLEEINSLISPEDGDILSISQWVPIFEADISGYGTLHRISSSWTTFRKVISRARLWLTNPEGECLPKTPPRTWEYSTSDLGGGGNPGSSDSWNSGPDYFGEPPKYTIPQESTDYPESPEFKWPYDIDYAARFVDGSAAPYYPIYERAFIWDSVLQKWGSLDHPHGLLFPTQAENSRRSIAETDGRLLPFGIVPKFPTPPPANTGEEEFWETSRRQLATYSNEFLERHQLPTALSSNGDAGHIWIDSIALTRDGFTKLVGLTAADLGTGTVEVRASFRNRDFPIAGEDLGAVDGLGSFVRRELNLATASWYPEFDPDASREYSDIRLPFVLTGKEFQIAVRGSFNLHRLICYGQPTGGLRFWGSNTYRSDT